MDSSALRMPWITTKGMHVCFFLHFFSIFNKGDDVSEETTNMISFHSSQAPRGCEGGEEEAE